jgi:putative RecB family exonuclease
VCVNPARLSVGCPTLPHVGYPQAVPQQAGPDLAGPDLAEPGAEPAEPGAEPAANLDVVPAAPGVDEPRAPALSPSRAGDFMTCPLLYRFRVIDRLPEPPSPAAVRGTLVHAVLERLFDRPSAERTPQAAHALLAPEWDRLVAESPELTTLFAGQPEKEAWLTEVVGMLDRYFTMEDPTRIEPAERELYVETTIDTGLRLRGYVDRVDVAAGGAVRIVDYKTGTAPREEFEARALFQMKFYALVLWRIRGEVPRLLQLMYLGNGEILRYQPDEADLRATERKIQALWRAIERAMESGDWRPRRSRVCDWCAHQAICPQFGGTPPPLPTPHPAATQPPAAEPDNPEPARPLPTP